MAKYRASMDKTFNRSRAPLWLPYLREIKHVKRDTFTFIYNGGEVTSDLGRISSIMLYGDFGSLDGEVLEQICRRGIPVILHRRGLAQPIYICTPLRKEQQDTLSAQLMVRADQRRCRHIARKLLLAKFQSMRWLIPAPTALPSSFSIAQMRNVEALHSQSYWREFFTQLGHPKATRRGNGGNVAMALNAVSMFLSGIILRWITYHHLSPFHGYLHSASDYSALVYDLIEPHRGHFDQVVFNTARSIANPLTNKALVGMAINAVKEALDEEVYTGLTRQIVTRHELFHGTVLSLKSYLLKSQRSFMVPTVDKPNGGRPRKTCFRLYGRQAGRTDFWKAAHDLAKRSAPTQ